MKKISLVYIKHTTLLGDSIINDTAKFLLCKAAGETNTQIETAEYGLIPPYKLFKCLYAFQDKLRLVAHCIEYKLFHNSAIFDTLARNIIFLLCVFYWLYMCRKDKNLFSYFDEITKSCDLVFFSGGGLFQQFYINMWAGVLVIVLNCAKRNIPVYINAVGLEKSDLILEHLLYKFILNHKIVRKITVRENPEYMRELLCGNKDFCHVLDTGLWADECYGVKKEKSDVIGIGVIRPKIFRDMGLDLCDKEVLDLYCGIIDELNKRGYKWQLFSNGGKSDYRFGKEIIKSKALSDDCLAKFPESTMELMNTIKNYKAVIAARMHAIIASTSLGIPTVSIVWAKKSLHLAKYLKLGACITFDKFFSPEYIADSLEDSVRQGVDTKNITHLKDYSYSVLKKSFSEIIRD